MFRSLQWSARILFLAVFIGGGGVALGYGPADANAQQAPETKCYLMVCTGSVCVAKQIECPVEPIRPST